MRGGRNDNYLFRSQTVEDTDNALLQCGTTDDAVIDNHQIVDTCPEAAVCYVIHVCRQIVPAITFGNESTQFDVLDRYLFRTDTARQDHFQFIVVRIMSQIGNLSYLFFIQVIVQPLKHTVKCHLRRIRYEREYGMVEIIINCLQDVRHQLFTQLFSLLIDVRVTTP